MFDDVTVEQLRARGSVKWSAFPDAIGAFIAEMDFGTAPAVTDAVSEALARNQFGYLPEGFKADLGEAYANFAGGRYGVEIDPERVRPVVDVVEGLIAVINHFTTAGSPVIVPTPAYMPFLTVGEVVGREIVQVPLAHDGDRYVYDLDALARAFTVPGQLLVLCNPHNPIGRVLEGQELREIAEVVEAHGGVVYSDEIHAPVTYPGHSHVPYASVSAEAARHSITGTSTSKAWNVPGLKAAQLVFSNTDHFDQWRTFGRRYEQVASTIGVLAATAAYTRGEGWVDEVVGYLDANRTALTSLVQEHLPGARYSEPEGTFLAWLDVRDLNLPGRAADFFRQHANVATTAGEDCGAPGFVRLNFATPAPILSEAVRAMGEAAAIHS